MIVKGYTVAWLLPFINHVNIVVTSSRFGMLVNPVFYFGNKPLLVGEVVLSGLCIQGIVKVQEVVEQ